MGNRKTYKDRQLCQQVAHALAYCINEGDPQAIMEGTLMPSFWEDGESMDEDILGGDAEKQKNALVKYLLEIGVDKLSPEQK